ncbi:MAG: SH3 domain-containing protein [Chloroflexi bacterium]|nr:SH3 domain-containing protein [Chloroflexota bacterium]
MPSATASATPSPTPTHTVTPTATATATPTVFALVRSQLRVNVRGGPGTDHDIVNILEPGSGVQILSENAERNWYQVQLDDGERGWISARLLQVVNPRPPTVPAPSVGTAPASPAAEAAATQDQDEPIGAAPAADEAQAIAEASGSQPQLVFNVPIIDLESINLTATVLVANAASPVPGLAEASVRPTDEPAQPTRPRADSVDLPTRVPAAPRSGVDVFAFCNNPVYGIGAPSNLTAGSTIEIFWAWFASTDAYLRQHIANATHELRINGTQISNVDQFRSAPRQRGRDQVVYWYVPYGPLEVGNYRITYRVTWRNAINDGYQAYGPGTGTEFEEESCNFVVR